MLLVDVEATWTFTYGPSSCAYPMRRRTNRPEEEESERFWQLHRNQQMRSPSWRVASGRIKIWVRDTSNVKRLTPFERIKVHERLVRSSPSFQCYYLVQ